MKGIFDQMKDRIERLIKRLKSQIESAEKLDSDWVYISVTQAKLCLELAEAEDTIMDALDNFNKLDDLEVPVFRLQKEET